MSFDSWLSHDPKQDDKMCDRCWENVGTQLYDYDWLCDNCVEVEKENNLLDREEEE